MVIILPFPSAMLFPSRLFIDRSDIISKAIASLVHSASALHFLCPFFFCFSPVQQNNFLNQIFNFL